MAYRDPVFNANVLTDLLGSYLDLKNKEREKYYQAEQKKDQTTIRQGADGFLYYINPRTKETSRVFEDMKRKPSKPTLLELYDINTGDPTLVMQSGTDLVEYGTGNIVSKEKVARSSLKPPSSKKSKLEFEDFPQIDEKGVPTGVIVKGMYTGTDKPVKGLPLGFENVGAKYQRKPEDPLKAENTLIRDTRDYASKRINRLRRLKEGTPDATDLMMINAGLLPAKWNDAFQEELDYYEDVLLNTRKYLPEGLTGIPVYGRKIEENQIKEEKEEVTPGSFWD